MDKKKLLKIIVLVTVCVLMFRRGSRSDKSVKSVKSDNYSSNPDLSEQSLLHGLTDIARGATSNTIYANQFPVRTGDSFVNSPILQETNKMVLPDGVYIIEDEETYLRKQYQINAAQNHVNILKIATATAIPTTLPAPVTSNTLVRGGYNASSSSSPSYNPFSPSFIAFNGGSVWRH